jgi:hypothetical protein
MVNLVTPTRLAASELEISTAFFLNTRLWLRYEHEGITALDRDNSVGRL